MDPELLRKATKDVGRTRRSLTRKVERRKAASGKRRRYLDRKRKVKEGNRRVARQMLRVKGETR